MRHVLPLEYPTVTSYPGRAYFYAISEKNEKIYPWLMENFIQTESYLDLSTLWCDIDFFLPLQLRYSSNMALEAQNAFCPYIDNFSINSEIIGADNVVDFVRKAIMDGYYVIADINTRYIPTYIAEKPYLHNMLIYGFDDTERKFCIADFMKNGKYSIDICLYQEFQASIEHFEDLECDFYPSGKSKLSLFRVSAKADCTFRVEWFNKSLSEYLGLSNLHKMIYVETNCFNTGENEKRVFGIGHYDNLVRYLDYAYESNKLLNNMRVFHVFYDHKKAMNQRLAFLNENVFDCSYESECFAEVVETALHIRNRYLKCYLKEKVDDYRNISIKLQNLKNTENAILQEMCGKLKKVSTL